MSNEPSTNSIKDIINRRGEPALTRWRDVVDKVIASKAEANPVDVADIVVQGEEERGVYEALELINKERRALRLLEIISTMDRSGGKMSVVDIVQNARAILDTRVTVPPTQAPTIQPYPHANVYVDVRIVQPSDWTTGQLCALIEMPAFIHGQNAKLSNLDLTRWHRNPVVFGVGGQREMPIGSGHGWVGELSSGIELSLQLMVDRESNKPTIQSLMSGEKRFVANVILTNSTGSAWAGELLAIEVTSAPREE